MQTIKPNDLVYIPSKTNTLQKVINDCSNLVIDDGHYRFTINEYGQRYDFNLDKWETQPFAFIATLEMKEKLEQIYGELEDIPVDKELREFCKVLDELLDAEFDRIDNGFTGKEVDRLKNELIEMFKERGKV